MWLTSEHEAVTLFSLKMSSATASGGKTLLAPTPYAVKMALLDLACREWGVAQAEQYWPELRALTVGLRPANQVVVTNLFQKVLKARRNPANPDDPERGPFQKTIGYREYAHLVGAIGLAVGWDGQPRREWLERLLVQLNYLGKRGGFFQMTRLPEYTDELPPGYLDMTVEQSNFLVNGTLQILDDCAPGLTFARANIYNKDEKVRLKKERILRNVILPYRMTRSSKSFTLYERIDL